MIQVNMANDIEEIKHRLDLAELIAEYTKLTPAGSNFRGLCPFHNEKTPSFMVSPEKQIWHCFGCGKGGDHFTFIQNIEGVEFPEALRILAGRAGVQLTYKNPEEHNFKSRLLDLLKTITLHWQQQLKAEAGKIAYNYLQGRQLKDETIADFALGYSSDAWDDAIRFLQSKGFSLKEIADAGLSITGEKGKVFDRFRNRLMFPIRDVHGNVVGFTSRKLREEDHGGKYVNSPQTVVYNKSNILYNLDLAKTEIKRLNYAILVEGNMDAIACYQAGTKNTVAISGTALTEEQVRLLKRYTQNLMIAFDADQAGVNANLRGIELAWQEGLNVKVIEIPQGKDPDGLIKESPNLWREQIKTAYNFMDYLFNASLKNLNLERVDHKKMAAKKILGYIAKLGDAVEQSHYLRKLSGILNVPEEALKSSLPKEKTQAKPEVKLPEAAVVGLDQNKILAEHLLGLLLKFPEQFELAIQHLDPEILQFLPAKELYKACIIHYNKEHNLTEKRLIGDLNKEQADYLGQLSLMAPEPDLNRSPLQVSHEIIQAINRLQERYFKNCLKAIQNQLAAAQKEGNQEKISKLSEEFSQVTFKLNNLKL